MAQLSISIGEEYKIKIEEGKKFKSSLFKSIYEKASKNVDDIIFQANDKRGSELSKKSDFLKSNTYNNIIAFIGERGTGKSSTMVSFAEALIHNHQKENVDGYFDSYINIKKSKFLPIEIVDPSLFNRKDTLFEIIISKMFSKFQKHLESNSSSNIDYEGKKNLLKHFQKVYENLKTVHSSKDSIYDQDVIEALSRLAKGTNLRDSFHKLTETYLDFFNKKGGFLLLAIDDFDLNITGAYDMLENIRQFLIQDNIIILLACKIEQLQNSLTQEIIKEYQILLKERKLDDQPKDTSEKYLTKLIPYEHRLLLENPEQNFIIKDNKSNNIIESNSVEQGILELIFIRTQFFISKSQYGIDTIAPKTLRELVNFVKYLDNANTNNLKSYLLNEVKDNLDESTVALFDTLETFNVERLNQYIYFWLSKSFDHRRRRLYLDKSYENYSFGDIFSVIDANEHELSITDIESLKRFFYIKIYYSIRVSNILKTDLLLSQWYFLGGVNTEEYSIFPKDQGTLRRDWIRISGFKSFREQLNNDNLLWLGFFISNYGKVENTSRDVGYFRFDNVIINSIDYVYFNPLAFLYNSFFPEKVAEILQLGTDVEFLNKMQLWRDENISLLTNYFSNIQFIQLFFYQLNKWAAEYRDSSLGDYNSTLKIYLINGINSVLTDIKKQYKYLNLPTSINEHPIIHYWNDNSSELSGMLNTFYQAYKNDMSTNTIIKLTLAQDRLRQYPDKEKLKTLADKALYEYQRYFTDEILSPIGAKQAMNNLRKLFREYQDISNDLLKFRRMMDRNLSGGLKEINNYLLDIANG